MWPKIVSYMYVKAPMGAYPGYYGSIEFAKSKTLPKFPTIWYKQLQEVQI